MFDKRESKEMLQLLRESRPHFDITVLCVYRYGKFSICYIL